MRQNTSPAEPATFEDIYAEHAERVLRLARGFGVLPPEHTDVAQEVWIDVHRSLPLFDPAKGTPRAWIAGIVRNASRDWKRTRRRRQEVASPDGQEPLDARAVEPTDETARSQRWEALCSFLERAVPNEEQRDAWLLHDLEGMTVEEVARATGVTRRTAKWRIEMARFNLKKAAKSLTDEERETLRTVLLPLGGADGILRALRENLPRVSDEEVMRVWDRVVERIEAGGGSIHDKLGTAAPEPARAPAHYSFTGPQLAGVLAGVFLLGGASGGAAHALWSARERASLATIETEIRPAPAPNAEQLPEPESHPRSQPTTTASPLPSSPPSVPQAPAMTAWESEAWILDHARRAEPAEALQFTEQHARRFPRSMYAAEREEIAIRALLKLGERTAAQERAEKLVRAAPEKRPALAALLGQPNF